DPVAGVERGAQPTDFEEWAIATIVLRLSRPGGDDLLDDSLVERRTEDLGTGAGRGCVRRRVHRFSLGSSASRSPSPRRVNPRTVSVIARAGKMMTWGALNSWLRSRPIIDPH